MHASRKSLPPHAPRRVAIVVSHPIQHFVHLYRGLAADPAIELKVFFASSLGLKPYFDRDMGVEIQWETDLLGGYVSEFLPGADDIRSVGLRAIDNPGVAAALAAFDPAVVQIHGYAQLTLLRALLWCRWLGVPVLLWSDSSLLFERPGWKRTLKRWLLPLLLRQIAAVLTTGDNNADYYRYYGVPPRRLFRCPFTVDQTLLDAARDHRPAVRASLRAQYGIAEDTFVALFVGKLVAWKRPQDLLAALAMLPSRRPEARGITAFFAGDGALMADLRATANAGNLPAVFAGFVNVDQLPGVYALADALVFPSSREPYGLAAREAICVGLPLIVSDQIGCIGLTDAARPQQNALVYPAGEVPALCAALGRLLDEAGFHAQLSASSLAVAADIDLGCSVRGFLAAVSAVAPAPSPADRR